MQPLQGIVVVAVEQAVAAPICTRHLGDLGARVIKIENRAGGDFARDYDSVVNGMSAYFAWANRNKESVALDLKQPLGRAALSRLVARADVLVQNLAPGAAGRLGLAPAGLRAERPELITVDISGYGRGGPYATARAYDLLVQSEAGSCSITGTPDQPAKPGIPLADIGAGMYALSSILTALFVRERTGVGTEISVGLFRHTQFRRHRGSSGCRPPKSRNDGPGERSRPCITGARRALPACPESGTANLEHHVLPGGRSARSR